MQELKRRNHKVKAAKIESFLLKALFLSVPILPKITTFLIIAWVVFRALTMKKAEWKILLERKSLVLCIFLYAWLLVGLLYTMNLDAGLYKIQTQVSFLIFPIFLGTKLMSTKQRHDYFKWFMWGLVVSVLLCLANATYRFFINGSIYVLDEFSRETNIFIYKEFSKILDLHPSYFALYLGIALFYLISNFNWDKSRRTIRDMLFILLFSMCLFLTASKAGIYLFILILIGFSTFWLAKGNKRRFIMVIAVLLTAGTLGYLVSPLPFKRLAHAWSSVQQIPSEKNVVHESTSIRMDLWRLSYKVAKESLILGYGTGSVQKVLDDKCIDFRFFSECELLRNKNSHNQYLNFLLSNGLVFLFSFSILMISWMARAIKRKDELSIFILLMMTLNLLFESILQRERGVVFFMLFITMLLATQNRIGQSKLN